MKIALGQDKIPRRWYNVATDMPEPLNPPLGLDGQTSSV